MIFKEVSVERLAFTCRGCDQGWSALYDVQHVSDGHGHDRDYYFQDGLPCPDPTGPGAVLCPNCGRALITVRLIARRASPAVTHTGGRDLGTRPDADKTAARAAAPLLSGVAEEMR